MVRWYKLEDEKKGAIEVNADAIAMVAQDKEAEGFMALTDWQGVRMARVTVASWEAARAADPASSATLPTARI